MTAYALPIAVAVLLAALAALLLLARRRRAARLSGPEAAADAAEAALADFRATDAVLGADGRAALVVAADGRVAVVRAARARATVREVDWAALRSTPDGVVVEAPGRAWGLLSGRLALSGVDARHVRRLVRARARDA